VIVFILKDPEEFQSLKEIFLWMDLQEELTPYNHPLCDEILKLRALPPLIHAASPNSPSESWEKPQNHTSAPINKKQQKTSAGHFSRTSIHWASRSTLANI